MTSKHTSATELAARGVKVAPPPPPAPPRAGAGAAAVTDRPDLNPTHLDGRGVTRSDVDRIEQMLRDVLDELREIRALVQSASDAPSGTAHPASNGQIQS